MTTEQGADERRIRQLLRARGVGPDATLPPPPPPPDDWWDRLYADSHTRPDSPPPVAPRLPDWRKGKTADLRGPDPDRRDKAAKPVPAAPADDDQDEPDEDEGWADVDDKPDAPVAPGRRPRPAARKQAHTAYLGLPARSRAALYTGTAAAAGYALGLVPLMNGWITNCGNDTSPKSAVILGVVLTTACGVLIDHSTRNWWGPLPWLCRIPLASAILALCLYAPGVSR